MKSVARSGSPPTDSQVLRLVRAVYPPVPRSTSSEERVRRAKRSGLGRLLAYRLATGRKPRLRAIKIAFVL